jgi:ABC-type phosphonate transport system ATPase subunit
MSREMLERLRARHAFDAAPLRSSMHALHVSFDELTGSRGCEARLLDAVRGGHRVALVGPSGSGKTSVTESVLGPLVEGLAPIPVPVYVETPEIATDPAMFARHIVGVVRRWVHDGLPRQASRAVEVGGRRRGRTQKLSVAPSWLGAKVELGYELRQATEDQPTLSSERLDQARQLLEIIAANDLRPVLVLDDTDRWLNASWQPNSETLRSAFFGRVIRVVAEDLATAAVVAVHPTYLSDPDYRAASGFLDTTIRVPALPSAAAVGRVLARRVAVALARQKDPVLDGLVSMAALELIFDQYRPDPDLRQRVLQVAHLALTLAVDDRAELLDEAHVQGALIEAS